MDWLARSSRSTTTTRPASSWTSSSRWRTIRSTDGRRCRGRHRRACRRGISLVIADLPADALLKAADAGRRAISCSSTSARPTIDCARRTAAAMWFIPPRRGRCWPTGWPNISSGSSGADGCWSSAPMPRTSSMAMRCGGPPSGSAREIVAGEGLRGYRRRAQDGQRRRPDSAPDAGVHARRAGLRCPGRGRRERGLCILSALSDLGCAPGRGIRRPGSDELGCAPTISGARCRCRTAS